MKLLKLLNHELTDAQINELENDFGVKEIVTVSPENAKSFAHVTMENYSDVIAALNREIAEIKPDYMFVQGQAGVVHSVINANPDVVSLFAFTQRISAEVKNPDGTVTKTAKFEHQKFMRY